MNRNTDSHFAINPTRVDMPRSQFKRPHDHKLTFNVGDVVPIYLDQDVLPGSTHKIRTKYVVRLQTPISAPMDNLYLDTYYFFIPNRLVWNHWKEFMGENNESAWIPETEYSVPQIEAPVSTGFAIGGIADHLGIRPGIPGLKVSALPFRAYALCMNEFFRSEAITDPLYIPLGDSDQIGTNGDSYINDTANGGALFKAARYFDVFSGALPSPQRGEDVLAVTMGQTSFTDVPVMTGDVHSSNLDPLLCDLMYYRNNIVPPNPQKHWYNYGAGKQYSFFANTSGLSEYSHGGDPRLEITPPDSVSVEGFKSRFVGSKSSGGDTAAEIMMVPNNLWAKTSDMSAPSVQTTVNQLRTAFQIQKWYEKEAMSGGRYVSMLKAQFGTVCPDYRLQRPELLGGHKKPILFNQVIQQSETGSTPQGNVTSYSITVDDHFDFDRSFTEHGIILGLAVVRYDHTYQQGIDRGWFRKDKFDYYFPVFANLGNQAIKNREIYCQGPTQLNPDTSKPYDDEVFGYQEAWYEYRYKTSFVTGEMRSDATISLDIWHFADDYQSMPYLSDDWLREDKSNVDRVLAVKSSVSNQMFGDFYFEDTVTNPMPIYSIPGLIDHH